MNLEINGLVESLAELSRNESLSKAATLLGEQICAEKGVENAVGLIEETFT